MHVCAHWYASGCLANLAILTRVVTYSRPFVARSESGELYGWGYGRHGVLGAELALDINNKPLRVGGALLDKKVIRFSCGGMHSVAITDTGSIFSWGEGREFKLGHQSDKDVLVPQQVQPFSNHVVTRVSCGSNATLLLRGSNSIAIYYRNEGRQLFPVLESPTVGDIYGLALNVRDRARASIPPMPHATPQYSHTAQFFKAKHQDLCVIDVNGHTISASEQVRRLLTQDRVELYLVARGHLLQEASKDLVLGETEADPPSDSGGSRSSGSRVPKVIAGTKEKLVEWLTHHDHTGT